ncbi:hypothetical protein ACWIGI_37490 [Nocardia sp. NPDC055321]
MSGESKRTELANVAEARRRAARAVAWRVFEKDLGAAFLGPLLADRSINDLVLLITDKSLQIRAIARARGERVDEPFSPTDDAERCAQLFAQYLTDKPELSVDQLVKAIELAQNGVPVSWGRQFLDSQ